MKDSRLIIRFIAILLISSALCFVSIIGARYATQYDLGQIAYMLVIFFPITAAIIGVMSSLYLKRLLLAPVIALIAFLTAMIASFGNINILYILIYMFISIAGYAIAYSIGKIAANKRR